MKFLFLSLICLLSAQAFSQSVLEEIVKNDTLRVGMSLDQPPFCMKDEDGNAQGYDVELAMLLAESMDVELKIMVHPFPDLLDGLNAGKYDLVISGLTITPKRNIQANFAGPYMFSGKAVLAYKGKYANQKQNKLNSPKCTLVALSNSTSQNFVKNRLPNANTIYVESYEQAIAMMQTNKADALVTDRAVIEVLDKQYPKEHFKYSDDDLLSIEPIGVAIGRNEAQFLNLVENYLATLDKLGYLDELQAKWFAFAEWEKYLEK